MSERTLAEFHQAVMAKMPGFAIPDELKAKCNQEFRGYLDGQEGSKYYHWLALAVEEKKPGFILELGTNRGGSAIAMWSRKPEGSELITIDIQDCGPYFPWQMVNEQGKTLHAGLGDDLLPHTFDSNIYNPLLQARGKVDFLFIDTDHRAEHFRKEWSIYREWLADGAIVAVDDINVNDMRETWDEMPFEKLDITADCHYSGFGVLRFKR